MEPIQVAAIVAGAVALVTITASVLLTRRDRSNRRAWPTFLAVIGACALVAAMLLTAMALFAAAVPGVTSAPSGA